MLVVSQTYTYLKYIGRQVVVQEKCSVDEEVWEVVDSITNAQDLQQ